MMKRLEDLATELPPDLSHGVPKNISSQNLVIKIKIIWHIYLPLHTHIHTHVRPQTDFKIIFEAPGSVL